MKLTRGFDLLATAPDGVARLRELIFLLAVQGKLLRPDVTRIQASDDKADVATRTTPAPYDLPPSWRWVRLGDVLTTIGSGWSPACLSEPQRSQDDWAVLKTTAVQVMKYLPMENKRLPPNLVHRPEIEVKAGDILITRAGPKNRVGICCVVEDTPPRLMISDKIIRIHIDGDAFDPRFAVLCLNAGWSRDQLEAAKSGMAESQMNVSQRDLQNIVLPLTDKAEQSRIVAKVDELMRLCDDLETRGRLEAEQHARLTVTLFEALAASESAHALAENWARVAANFDLLLDRPEPVDALEQTILQLATRGLLMAQDPKDEPVSDLLKRIRTQKDALIAAGKIRRDKSASPVADDELLFGLPTGWAWVRTPQIGESRLGKMLDKAKNSGASYPYLRNTNVQWNCFELDDIKLIQLEEHELDEYRLQYGDLLICEGGEPGRCAIWREEAAQMYFQKALHRFRALGGVRAEYIALCLEADAKSGRLDDYFTGATIKHFAGQELARYCLPLPPVAEQERIIARVEELRRICASLRARLIDRQACRARLAEALVEQTAAAGLDEGRLELAA